MIENIKRWKRSWSITDLRDSFKRTANITKLDEDSESKHESKEVDDEAESADQYADSYYHTLF